MAAQSIERRRALAGEQLAPPIAHQRGLVVDRTHRHEPLARTTHRLVDRRRVNLVAFVAAHVGLHMRRRQQSNLVSKFDQRPPPMMRRGARLHRHHARRQRGEKRDELAARELARNNTLALRVDCVNLKDPLRQIQTNPRRQRPSWHADAVRGAVHPIIRRRRGERVSTHWFAREVRTSRSRAWSRGLVSSLWKSPRNGRVRTAEQ
jgi:hypothetical protein